MVRAPPSDHDSAEMSTNSECLANKIRKMAMPQSPCSVVVDTEVDTAQAPSLNNTDNPLPIAHKAECWAGLEECVAAFGGANDTMALVVGSAAPFPILHATPSWLKMCGYTTDEVIGRTPKILQGEGTEEGQLSALMEAVNEREVKNVSLTNYKKDGECFVNNLTVLPLCYSHDTSDYLYFACVTTLPLESVAELPRRRSRSLSEDVIDDHSEEPVPPSHAHGQKLTFDFANLEKVVAAAGGLEARHSAEKETVVDGSDESSTDGAEGGATDGKVAAGVAKIRQGWTKVEKSDVVEVEVEEEEEAEEKAEEEAEEEEEEEQEEEDDDEEGAEVEVEAVVKAVPPLYPALATAVDATPTKPTAALNAVPDAAPTTPATTPMGWVSVAYDVGLSVLSLGLVFVCWRMSSFYYMIQDMDSCIKYRKQRMDRPELNPTGSFMSALRVFSTSTVLRVSGPLILAFMKGKMPNLVKACNWPSYLLMYAVIELLPGHVVFTLVTKKAACRGAMALPAALIKFFKFQSLGRRWGTFEAAATGIVLGGVPTFSIMHVIVAPWHAVANVTNGAPSDMANMVVAAAMQAYWSMAWRYLIEGFLILESSTLARKIVGSFEARTVSKPCTTAPPPAPAPTSPTKAKAKTKAKAAAEASAASEVVPPPVELTSPIGNLKRWDSTVGDLKQWPKVEGGNENGVSRTAPPTGKAHALARAFGIDVAVTKIVRRVAGAVYDAVHPSMRCTVLTCLCTSIKNHTEGILDPCLYSARCLTEVLVTTAAELAASAASAPLAASAAVASWGPIGMLVAAVSYCAHLGWAFMVMLVEDLRTHGHPHHGHGHGHGEHDEEGEGAQTMLSDFNAILLAANVASVVLLGCVLAKEFVKPVVEVYAKYGYKAHLIKAGAVALPIKWAREWGARAVKVVVRRAPSKAKQD